MKTRIMILIFALLPFGLMSQILNIPQDYPTIQDGINNAVNGDTILVDEGTYYENINFKGKSVVVASRYICF